MIYDPREPSREARRRIKAGEGFIYIAHVAGDRSGPGAFVKIGFSLRPVKRVQHYFVTEYGYRSPTLLGYTPGSMREEHALHKKLRDCRLPDLPPRMRELYTLDVLDHPALPPELVWAPPLSGIQFIERTRKAAA